MHLFATNYMAELGDITGTVVEKTASLLNEKRRNSQTENTPIKIYGVIIIPIGAL